MLLDADNMEHGEWSDNVGLEPKLESAVEVTSELSRERRQRYEQEAERSLAHHVRMQEVWREIEKLPRNGKILLVNMVYKGLPGHPNFSQVSPELQKYYFDAQTGGQVLTDPEEFVPAQFGYYFGLEPGDERLEVVNPKSGQPIELNPSDYGAIVLTGSEAMMTWVDEQPERAEVGMINTTKEFLGRVKLARVPVLGICFGSQVYASANNGKVDWISKNPECRTTEFGPSIIHLTDEGARDPIFEGLPSSFGVIANHSQHVTTLPEEAVVLAGNETSPVQTVRFAPGVYTIQNHPEATNVTTDVSCAILADKLQEVGLDAKEAKARVLSTDTHLARTMFANFLKIASKI